MDAELARKIQGGAVGVCATDTIYGLIGSALMPEVVERMYAIKGRRSDKPFIILISNEILINSL